MRGTIWILAWAVLALAACDAGPSAVVHDGDGKSPQGAKPKAAPAWAAASSTASLIPEAPPPASTFAPAPETVSPDIQQRDLAVAQSYPPLPEGARADISETRYGDWPLWSKTRKYSPAENSRLAFGKHGAEVGAKSYEDYMAMVHHFVHAPPKGTATLTRANGDVLMFDGKDDVFAVITKTGAPRTLFRPFDGQAYWQKQQIIETARAAGSGSGGDGGD